MSFIYFARRCLLFINHDVFVTTNYVPQEETDKLFAAMKTYYGGEIPSFVNLISLAMKSALQSETAISCTALILFRISCYEYADEETNPTFYDERIAAEHKAGIYDDDDF